MILNYFIMQTSNGGKFTETITSVKGGWGKFLVLPYNPFNFEKKC